ncbi:MAG: sporulation protein [Oscillospiraceae bacterium]|nr:sporulation protein [Oscillospiraceae bacterium]
MKNKVAVSGALCAMLCLVFAPAQAIESARSGLSLCAELIAPSLLPFFTASALLIRLGVPRTLGRALSPLARRLWGVSGAGASAFFAGICGGYPLGAQTAAELYLTGQIEKAEAERLLRFCNNSGPSFLVGVIGAGIFSSRAAGMLLYAVHVSAALITGVLFRSRVPLSSVPRPSEELSISEALVASVRQAVSAVLGVCGFVVCFCVLSGLLDALGCFDAAAAFLSRLSGVDARDLRALLIGLLELSNGIGALRGLNPSAGRFVLAAFLCGWGGLSVQFQTMAVLVETDLDARGHLIGRVSSALLSALLAYALVRFFPFLPPA